MRKPMLAAIVVTSALTLAACEVRQPTTDTNTVTTTTTTESNTGVTRQEVTPEPTGVPAAPVPAAIQTQPGPKGSTVALNKVAVTGDILTVGMTYTGGSCCAYVKLDQVSVIDDATSQRISVLKDNAGNWMAAPLDNDGKQLRIGWNNDATQVWYKFPAPPATSKTVSIAIPEVAPFDAVPVTR